MRTKSIILFTILMISMTGLHAQNEAKYRANMLALIQRMDSIGSESDKFVSLGADFERIGNAEQKKWLPYYYAAYCFSMKALITSEDSEELANRADKLLDLAEKRGGDKSEIYCIKSYAATARLLINPQQKWMTDGKASSDFINQAINENPENPRAYLLLGQSVLYTPKEYGGGNDAAKQIFNKALEKFKLFKPQSDISPQWGEKYTNYLLSKIKVNK